MEIEYLDSIHCKADKEAVKVIKKSLSYKSSFWKKSAFGKKKIIKDAYFIDGRTGVFLTGFLPVVEKVFKGKINFKNKEVIKPECRPNLKGIKFYDYQEQLIDKAIQYQRGVIKSPTGTGKTIVTAGIISCYPNKNILLLCHSISILNQTKVKFEEDFGFKCNLITGESKDKKIRKGITLAIDKSFSKIDYLDYICHFDIVLIDESHHVISRKSLYGKILQKLLAPIKLGFTATPPKEREKLLSMQGLLGPVIGEITIQEMTKKGVFVKPKIKLVSVPVQNSVSDLFKYNEVYKAAIINSTVRNTLIIKNAVERIKQGKTCLIMIKDLDHGENLLDIVDEKFPDYLEDFIFIKGATESKVREYVKNSLEDKKIKCVIVTAIWREGVNIKSLNSVILALGGKSSIQVLQAIGRGTRKSDGKTEVEIIDFIDRYKYLAQHFTERLTIYLKEKWL
jgi:superfamily II DNA or RNA helicase